jgi:Tfp pilus assembly protein PilV
MKNQRGVSALEMLLVLAFISIAFLAVLQLLSSSLISSGEMQGSVVAQNLANKKVEEIMTQDFSAISVEARTEFSDFPEYSYTVGVTSSDAHLKTVQVVVYWEVAGAEMSYTVDTALTDW